MRVDFYHLTEGPVESAVPALAAKALESGERLIIVSADADQRQRISEARWAHKPESFLAHGQAGGPHDARQPILLGAEPDDLGQTSDHQRIVAGQDHHPNACRREPRDQ